MRELLGQEISKQQQSSDWGGPVLSDAQKEYAAADVRYLHALREELDRRLAREGRAELAQACFDFLPHRALLDPLLMPLPCATHAAPPPDGMPGPLPLPAAEGRR